MARADRTALKRQKFLDALEETASVSAACKQSGLPRRTAYEWKEADVGFAKAWEAALDRAVGVLEDEAVRRAMVGVDKPVFHQGKRCGVIREYSDTLLIFLLKAQKPEKYRERFEHTGANGKPIEIEETPSLERARRLAYVLTEAAIQKAKQLVKEKA